MFYGVFVVCLLIGRCNRSTVRIGRGVYDTQTGAKGPQPTEACHQSWLVNGGIYADTALQLLLTESKQVQLNSRTNLAILNS